jgi:hypothetical protein
MTDSPSANSGTGAKLIVGGAELSVPSLRGGTPAGIVHPTPGTSNPDAHPPPIASMQVIRRVAVEYFPALLSLAYL